MLRSGLSRASSSAATTPAIPVYRVVLAATVAIDSTHLLRLLRLGAWFEPQKSFQGVCLNPFKKLHLDHIWEGLFCLKIKFVMAACPDPFEATGGWVSNRKVLVCIAGAPGSGKSTLCEALCQQIDNCVTLSVDEAFDSLQLEQQGKASPTGDASVLALHAAAERVQRACKRLLEDPGANVILIDDTLHLPSMRKPFFQMAREG